MRPLLCNPSPKSQLKIAKPPCAEERVKDPHPSLASAPPYPRQIAVRCDVCVFKLAVRYIGVRAADGSVEHQADAAASSKLLFHWTVCRGDAESLHESEVKCDYALDRGVPHPETYYCTKAELDHIAMNAALSHETALRKKSGQGNVVVMCKCAPIKIETQIF